MYIKKILVIALFLPIVGFSQDTTKVKAFNFQSITRDTLVQFPVGSDSYEKIIMAYGMRCKGARISTGQNRNLGCGEWDYSCNTYIIDSTKIDSLANTTTKYIFNNYTENVLNYVLQPIYDFFRFTHTATQVNNLISENMYPLGLGINDTTILNRTTTENVSQRLWYFIDGADLLQNTNVGSGNIDGLALQVLNSVIDIPHFQIRLKSAAVNRMEWDDYSESGFQTVFLDQATLNQGINKLMFHEPFNWDGTSGILVEITVHNSAGQPDLMLTSMNGNAFVSGKEKSINLLENSYIEIDGYKGIVGNQNRSIDAWVKLNTADGEICSWGTDVTGQKWVFRTHSNGNLRVEVNGGFIIGSTNVLDNQWHHVACVLEGNNVTDIKFYVDGNLETITESENRAVNTGNNFNLRVSRGVNNRYLKGGIDRVRLWSRALSANEIKEVMWSKRTTFDQDLSFHFDLANDLTQNLVVDLSGNGRNGTIIGSFQEAVRYGMGEFRSFQLTKRPFSLFVQGNYDLSFQETLFFDSIAQLPIHVDERSVNSRGGTILSDLIAIQTQHQVWNTAIPSYVFDESLNLIQSNNITSTGTFNQENIPFWQRWPSSLEIMSLVTPYGINLDLGQKGKTWIFDVTDFASVLKNSKRIRLSRGGQNQEEMDIEFWFIKGTPPREVKNIDQIWLTEQVQPNYTQIQENTRFFPPVTYSFPNDMKYAKVRSSITGHGQQGEFIPRNHQLIAGDTTFEWRVWKACGDNPVYPQGGTWIYDRAGWCPSMATDLYEWDVTRFVKDKKITVDYTVVSGDGDSRYIVNHQMVTYGEINHQLDARITEITQPTNRVEYARYNPMCDNPKIIIQNAGKENITDVLITFWVNNGSIKKQHRWRGNLGFMESTEVSLLYGFDIWADGKESNNIFHAEIETVNGKKDDNAANNHYQSSFEMPIVIPSKCIVFFRTNNVANQNTLTLKNADGTTILEKKNLQNNTVYRDTLDLYWGCYTLRLDDSGGNGINFWATPNDGNGLFMITNMAGAPVHFANPDFGDFHQVNFTTNHRLSTEKTNINPLKVYPNPSNEVFHISGLDFSNTETYLFDLNGRNIQVPVKNSEYTISIDLKDYAPGLYLLQVRKNNELYTLKLIKN